MARPSLFTSYTTEIHWRSDLNFLSATISNLYLPCVNVWALFRNPEFYWLLLFIFEPQKDVVREMVLWCHKRVFASFFFASASSVTRFAGCSALLNFYLIGIWLNNFVAFFVYFLILITYPLNLVLLQSMWNVWLCILLSTTFHSRRQRSCWQQWNRGSVSCVPAAR